jgi:hypothetical protein
MILSGLATAHDLGVAPRGHTVVGARRYNLRAVTPTRKWLEDELRRAILLACRNDKVLLGRDASERSIMFRVGRYLAPAVEERWTGRMWVDLEYNRIANHEKAKVVKQVSGLLDVPDKKHSVFPDLIVHDRNGSSKDHNILIVEAKKFPAASCAEAYDRRKLDAYQHDLMYQYAVYLELGEQPLWQWIGIHDKLRSVTDRMPAGSGDASSSGDVQPDNSAG